jgi:hypothetical protein
MKGVGALKPSLLLSSFTVTFLTGGMRALVVKVIHVSLLPSVLTIFYKGSEMQACFQVTC